MKREELLQSLDIGSSIRRLREKKGLSQEELARGICDRTNITKLENGHSKIPSFSFILLICDRLEISLEEFLNFSTSNHYSLNKKAILDALMDNDFKLIQEYLQEISSSLLSKTDQKYYNYLLAKIEVYNHNINKAKQILLTSIKDINKSNTDYVDILCLHELAKNKMISANSPLFSNLYANDFINKLINKKSNTEYIYLINDLLRQSIDSNQLSKAKFLLEKQIQFINNHDCYRYLPYYYKNKIHIYKDDSFLIRDLENKIFAIRAINKKIG